MAKAALPCLETFEALSYEYHNSCLMVGKALSIN